MWYKVIYSRRTLLNCSSLSFLPREHSFDMYCCTARVHESPSLRGWWMRGKVTTYWLSASLECVSSNSATICVWVGKWRSLRDLIPSSQRRSRDRCNWSSCGCVWRTSGESLFPSGPATLQPKRVLVRILDVGCCPPHTHLSLGCRWWDWQLRPGDLLVSVPWWQSL